MTPQILTYILFFGSAAMMVGQYFIYKKNKAKGFSTSIRPLQLIATFIIFVIALYAIVTNQTYDDILSRF